MTRDEAIAAGEDAYNDARQIGMEGYEHDPTEARAIAFGSVWDAAMKAASVTVAAELEQFEKRVSVRVGDIFKALEARLDKEAGDGEARSA